MEFSISNRYSTTRLTSEKTMSPGMDHSLLAQPMPQNKKPKPLINKRIIPHPSVFPKSVLQFTTNTK